MSKLSEQFSQVRNAQIDAQLAMFRSFSSKAVESAEKVIALNLRTSRTTLEQSTAAVQQLLSAKDPRALLSFGAQTQENLNNLMAYQRALFGIAAGSRVVAAPPVEEAAPLSLAAPEVEPELEPEIEAQAAPEIAAQADPEPVVVEAAAPAPVESDIEAPAIATLTTMAEAVSHTLSAAPADTPAAAPLPPAAEEIAVTGIEPVIATAPLVQPETGGTKKSRKNR